MSPLAWSFNPLQPKQTSIAIVVNPELAQPGKWNSNASSACWGELQTLGKDGANDTAVCDGEYMRRLKR
ncbi:MAG TPA: hypothetical protein VHL14_08280 [Steroidobacteraceae bacterium]|nr:hypothetical protein [Steroidobacteraceae bacterium]